MRCLGQHTSSGCVRSGVVLPCCSEMRAQVCAAGRGCLTGPASQSVRPLCACVYMLCLSGGGQPCPGPSGPGQGCPCTPYTPLLSQDSNIPCPARLTVLVSGQMCQSRVCGPCVPLVGSLCGAASGWLPAVCSQSVSHSCGTRSVVTPTCCVPCTAD